MAIIKSFSPFLNLSNFQVFENDEEPNSEYFRISELSESLTGGKNGFLIEGSEHLKESTEIKVEILDVDGNPVYFEPGGGSPQYYEGNSKLVSVHVYDDTSIGLGKITILGELKTYRGESNALIDIPAEWKGVYNVKWERDIQINKNIQNETIVRFYQRPTVKIDELVKPIFTKVIPDVTQTGTISGIPQNPPAGSDLSTWRAGTSYKLKIDDDITNWTSSVDDNTISVSSLNYSPTVQEVLSNTEVLVDTPYTSSNGEVASFVGQSYNTTFEFVEGQTITDSALTGSFAKINFNNLKTFVGDVARVKVFRKSRNTIGDFQFVQESKLESSELLKDVTTTADTELSYGRFDQSNLDNYWISSSNDHPVTINSDKLNASAKIDYDSSEGGTQILSTSSSFEITSGIEYTLNFKTLKSGSEGTSQSIRAYFSGSNYEQNFLTISGSAIYNTRQSVSQNILANTTAADTFLKFDVIGGDWYISNVSLKNAQDTSFSPDEFTLIQDIPRKLAIETFDFKFEFYDINNNYIPVDVISTKSFTGGNDFPSSDKLMVFESDRNAFRFSSGSIGNPPFQQIQFKTSTNNLTGSITFASSAFDIGGAYINPSEYSGEYPGRLTNPTNAGAIISIANFSGSDDSIRVGSIIYTASIEELEEFETVYRLEDGDNAPQLIVTSNANQFTYEPTTLSPKPAGQTIKVRAQRKNLTSLTTPIEVNSGSNTPPLSPPTTDNGTGIDTYTINALQFSSSFASNNFDEVTYSFTGSDQFGIDFSDEITLSKVINFDAVSLVVSNESTAFPALSTGVIIGGLAASEGKIQMNIGSSKIIHDDIGGGRNKNTFDIKTISGTNVTPIEASPTTNKYGISAFSSTKDSGSLTLDIEYLAGDNSTSQSFEKEISYTKSKNSVPNVEVSTTPQSQTINCNSRGSGSIAPATITVNAKEGGTNRFTSMGTLVFSGGISGSKSSNTVTFTQGASDMISDTETVTIPVSFTDSEGISGTKNIIASFSRVKIGEPNVEVSATPQSQTINCNSRGSGSVAPSTITVNAKEGGTNRFTSIGNLSFSGGISGSKSTNTVTFTQGASDMTSDAETVTIPVNFTDSEGTTGTKNIIASFSRVKKGEPNVEVAVSPQSQALNANSLGNGTASPATITITATEGGTNRFTSISTPTISGGLSGTVSTNTITFSDTVSDMSSEISNVTIPINFTDSEGTTGTKTISATITRVKSVPPGVNISANPQAQSVASNADFSSVSAPSAVTIAVNEGGSNYTYTTSTVTANKFKITNVTNGTNNNNGTITPTTPSSGAGTTSVVTLSYTNSEGSAFTSKTITINVGVAAQGDDGADGPSGISAVAGLNFDVSPASQNITRHQTPISFGNPGAFTVNVIQGSTTFSYDNSSPYTSGSFFIDSVGSGSNNNNKTITPTTPSNLTAVTTTFDINYTDISGSSGTISKSHIVNVVLDGNPGPGIIHTGEWAAGRNYIFNPGASGGTARRDTVYVSSTGVYHAANTQHTSTAAGVTGPPGTGTNWDSLGSQDLFVAAKVAIFEDSFVQNTLNVGTNNNGGLNVANIALVGGTANPYIAIGQSSHGWGNNGIWIGNHNNGGTPSYRMSLASDGNHMKWNGSTLDIKGSIEITAGATADVLGHLLTETGSLQTGIVGATSSGSLGITNAATADGKATTAQGTANAATASAAGAQSTADGINANTGSLRNPTDYSFGGDATFDFEALPNSISTAGLYMGSNNLGYHDGTNYKSYMDNSGNFYLGGTSGALQWNGTSLSIAGSITISNPSDIDISSINNDSNLTGVTDFSSATDAAAAAQDTADAKTDDTAANAAAATANAATGSAAAAQATADGINANTGSLTNPTTFSPSSAAGTTAGLHLGSNMLGYSDGTNFVTAMTNGGDFFLGGSSGPLTWTAGSSTLNVNRVTATTGTIGGWAIGSSHIGASATATADDSYGTFTLGSTGYISSTNFKITAAGVATFKGIIEDSAVLNAGGTSKPWSSIFATDNVGIFLNLPRFKETSGGAAKTFGSRFSGIETAIDSELDDIADNVTGYGCVLPGTKIITERGEVNIEDTHQDDIIKVYNFFTETWEWSPIDEIRVIKVKGWSHIKTKLGIELKCSNSHWLYHPDYPHHKIETDKLGVDGQLYVYHEGEIKVDIITSIDTFDEEVDVWNYELKRIHNYVSDGVLSHNMAKAFQTTLSHQYIKNKSVSISSGDLVTLDSNNELQKVTTSKNNSVVGILWEKLELQYPSFGLTSIGGESVETSPPPESFVSSSFVDSFGDFIPTNQTGSKEIWKVATIGDSVEYDASGSLYTLQGFKMCNQGGNILPGDLLCSSDTEGYLMKQPSEWVVTSFDGDNNPQYEERQNHCSYTVAKSMVSSSWDSDGRMEAVYGYLYCG